MSAFSWDDLSGRALPDGFTLSKIFHETPYFALFRAHSTSESLQPEATVEVVSPQEPAQNIVNRFLEASYLRHPNLTGISAAGVLDDRGLVYSIAEPVEGTLADIVAQRVLPPNEATDLLDHLISALAYLHAENLVFCNLRPEAVWRTASSWKLGDFSQLRLIGSGNSKDLRAALARRPDLPPEVYEGVVTPAWDVWSLGLLLRRIVEPLPAPAATITGRSGRQLRPAELPAPFEAIARDCLDPNPESRITVDQIRSRLHPGNPARRATRATDMGTDAKNRVMGFVRTFPAQPARVKALLAVLAAILLLTVLVSANSFFRHGGAEGPALIAQAPVPIVMSDADRAVPPPAAKPAASALPADVKALLDQWVTSTKTHDVRANLDCYAPLVESYYTKRQLSKDDMAREKKHQFDTIGAVRSLVLDHLQFTQLGPDRAVVLFDKHWSFGDRNSFSGAERAQLNLRNVGGDWKIAGERELKVYWVRRGHLS